LHFAAENCRVCQGTNGRHDRQKGTPMTSAAITEKHTEEDYEKKEKKLTLKGNLEMLGAFDGIDSDLRLDMILNGRV
jgi:hypothetical protein